MAFDDDRNRVVLLLRRKASRQAMITPRSRNYLVRHGL